MWALKTDHSGFVAHQVCVSVVGNPEGFSVDTAKL